MRAVLKYIILVVLIIYLGVSYFIRSSHADGWGRAYLFEIPFIGGFNWWLVVDVFLILAAIVVYKKLSNG